MHKRFVANIIARILRFVCFMMMLPLGWALHDNPHSTEVLAFVATIGLGFGVSFLTAWQVPITEKDYDHINAKDGLAIVGLSWLVLSFFGALPFYFSEVVPTFTDAFFETVSGFTTTGATIFSNIEILPRGILFWRSLTHWLGGMGIIVLYLALLPALGLNAFQLYKAEAPGVTVERIAPQIRDTAKMLWSVYFLLSLVECLLLWLGEMDLFEALCHTFGTMATGGFSTRNVSIAAFSPYSQWVISLFMFLAGMNFMLHYLLLIGRIKSVFKNEEFRLYVGLVIASIMLLFFASHGHVELRDIIFQIVSVLTTTGFITADFDLWSQLSRFWLVFLMFIGGCCGSTGGGMKVMRFFLSIKVALRSIVQSMVPNAIVPIRFNGTSCSEKIVLSVVSYFIIYILLFFFGTILFTLTEDCGLVTSFSASIACLSNIGPGLAKVGATQNYEWISIPGKWLLCFLMLAGRLELYSILILLIPLTWKK